MLVLPISCKGLPIPYFKWNIPRWKNSSAGKVSDIICLYRSSATKRGRKKKRGGREKKIPSPSCTCYLSSCVRCQQSCALWAVRNGVAPEGHWEEETGCLSLCLRKSVLHSSHFLHAWLKLKGKNTFLALAVGATQMWTEWKAGFCLPLCHCFLWPEG